MSFGASEIRLNTDAESWPQRGELLRDRPTSLQEPSHAAPHCLPESIREYSNCLQLPLEGFGGIGHRWHLIHRSAEVKYTSDCDVLAIRPPGVFEESGGKPEDWDRELAETTGFDEYTNGLICEVTTGAYEMDTLFRTEYVKYSVGRLGLCSRERIDEIATTLAGGKGVEIDGNRRIWKLLVANDDTLDGSFVFRSVNTVEDFIVRRIETYPAQKHSDRMFFHSSMFQQMIHNVRRKKKTGKAGSSTAEI